MAENFHFEHNPVPHELPSSQEIAQNSFIIPTSPNQVTSEKLVQDLSAVPLVDQPHISSVGNQPFVSTEPHPIETVVRTTRQIPTDTQLSELAQYFQSRS